VRCWRAKRAESRWLAQMGTGGSRHAVRRLLFVGAVLAGLSPGGAMAATSHTMSGRLIGVPRGASTTIEAVAVRRDAVVAARTLRGSRYTVRVPAGPTFVLVRVVDIRRHRQLDGIRREASRGRCGASTFASASRVRMIGSPRRLPRREAQQALTSPSTRSPSSVRTAHCPAVPRPGSSRGAARLPRPRRQAA
jgi:hypothetical protein